MYHALLVGSVGPLARCERPLSLWGETMANQLFQYNIVTPNLTPGSPGFVSTATPGPGVIIVEQHLKVVALSVLSMTPGAVVIISIGASGDKITCFPGLLIEADECKPIDQQVIGYFPPQSGPTIVFGVTYGGGEISARA